MKNKTLVSRRTLLAAAAGTLAAASVPGMAIAAPRATGPYRYPVVPGTPEWASLKNYREMVQATQLPDGLAERLSTSDLASTVLAYPLLPTALSFNDVQSGIDAVTRNFGGLRELLSRPDAGSVLHQHYQAFDIVPAGTSTLQAGNHGMSVWKLEALLSQPDILAGFSADGLAALLRTGRRQLDGKRAHAAYGVAGYDASLTLLGRALAGREGWNYRVSPFLRSASKAPAGATEMLVAAVDQHLAGGGTFAGDITAGPTPQFIYTPLGTKIQVFQLPEMSAAEIADRNRYIDYTWPNAIRETSATSRYNCHSYTFYSTSNTSNTYWMERWWRDPAAPKPYPNVSRYWTDGSYLRWNPPQNYLPNMKIVYWTNDEPGSSLVPIDHSGIEVGTTGYIRSKWGLDGRVYHQAQYCPFTLDPDRQPEIRHYYR